MTSFEQFAVRFYRWAALDFEQEIAAGFPLLRGIQDLIGSHFVGHISGLSAPAQACLASGLVKRFHLHAVQLLNDPITDAEAAAIQRYLDSDLSMDEVPQTIPRHRIRTLLEKDFLHQLPDTHLQWNGAAGLVTTCIGPVTIETTLDLASPVDRLAYQHKVIAPGWSFDLISALSWMGIGFATSWSEATDEYQIVEGFRAVFLHFMNAMPGLLQPE